MLQEIRDFVVRSIALVAVSALALTLGLVAAPSAVADNSAEAALTGRVVDDTGTPVVGASVTTYVWNGAGWQDVSTVDVDDAGIFTVTNLVLDGRYRLEIVGPWDSPFLPANLGGAWGSDDADAIVTT